jgi:hypothetical protein
MKTLASNLRTLISNTHNFIAYSVILTVIQLQIYVSSIQSGTRKLIASWRGTNFRHLNWNGTANQDYRDGDNDESAKIRILKGFVICFKLLSLKWLERTERIYSQKENSIDWPKFELGASRINIQSLSAMQFCSIFCL